MFVCCIRENNNYEIPRKWSRVSNKRSSRRTDPEEFELRLIGANAALKNGSDVEPEDFLSLRLNVLKNIEDAAIVLKEAKDSKGFSDDECRNTIMFLLKCSRICTGKHSIHDHITLEEQKTLKLDVVGRLIDTGVCEALIAIFDELVTNQLPSRFSDESEDLKRDEDREKPIVFLICRIIQNLSSESLSFCQSALECEILDIFRKILKDLFQDHIKEVLTSDVEKFLIRCFRILNNFCLFDDISIIDAILDSKMEPIAKEYLQSTEDRLLILVLLLIIQLITQEDDAESCLHDKCLIFLLNNVNFAFRSEDKSHNDCSLAELLRGLFKVSAWDVCKRKLCKLNADDLLVSILKTGKDKELTDAVIILNQLSFNDKNARRMNKKHVVDVIEPLTIKSKTNDVMIRDKSGLLYNVKTKGKQHKRIKSMSELIPTYKARETTRRHIMVSYQWDHQSEVKKIVEAIQKEGYMVWVDKNCMTGDVDQAMADAVEGSWLILLCMSKNYKNSRNCRKEARYGNDLNKTFIPLRMDHYEPDGWLGFMTSGLLYYDFSGNFPFEDKLIELIAAINKEAKEHHIEPVESNENQKFEDLKDWETEDVKKWCLKNNITWTERMEMDGKELRLVASKMKELLTLGQVDTFLHAIRKI